MKIADLSYDMDILKKAEIAAEETLASDPGLERDEHKELLAKIKSEFSM